MDSLKKSDIGSDGPRRIIGGGGYSRNKVGGRYLEVPGPNKEPFWALMTTVVLKNADIIRNLSTSEESDCPMELVSRLYK